MPPLSRQSRSGLWPAAAGAARWARMRGGGSAIRGQSIGGRQGGRSTSRRRPRRQRAARMQTGRAGCLHSRGWVERTRGGKGAHLSSAHPVPSPRQQRSPLTSPWLQGRTGQAGGEGGTQVGGGQASGQAGRQADRHAGGRQAGRQAGGGRAAWAGGPQVPHLQTHPVCTRRWSPCCCSQQSGQAVQLRQLCIVSLCPPHRPASA